MQYQTCECGERIPPNELPTKLLTHWNHQQNCLYLHIGCVSKTNFDNNCVEDARTGVLVDRCFPAYGRNLRLYLYWKIRVSKNPHSRILYAVKVLFKSVRLAVLGVNVPVKMYLFL